MCQRQAILFEALKGCQTWRIAVLVLQAVSKRSLFQKLLESFEGK